MDPISVVVFLDVSVHILSRLYSFSLSRKIGPISVVLVVVVSITYGI